MGTNKQTKTAPACQKSGEKRGQRKPMTRDTSDFLVALLWAYPEDGSGNNPMSERTIYDFSDAFVSAVSGFISGFRGFLDSRDIDIPDSPCSFGGNVYLSLSGHGCGFWDSAETEHLQAHLEAYSGNKYRFEQLYICEDESGKLDLAIIPESIAKYREKMFSAECAKGGK